MTTASAVFIQKNGMCNAQNGNNSQILRMVYLFFTPFYTDRVDSNKSQFITFVYIFAETILQMRCQQPTV